MRRINGIAEIVLNAHDLDGMTRFYQDVLGFSLHSQFPFHHPTIVFLTITETDSLLGRTHPQMLVLIDPDRHPSAVGKFDQPTSRPFSLNHLAFEIDEAHYEPELERLGSLGIETIPSRFPHLHAKAIFFQDPEGNRLELICHDSSSTVELDIAAKETSEQIQRAIDDLD